MKAVALALLLCGCVFTSCRFDDTGLTPPDGGQEVDAEPDPCGASELPFDGGCAQICANQLHCWSGCCLPAGDGVDAGADEHTVCMPESLCFGDR